MPAGRNVDVAKVRQWIDHGVYSAESAKEAGIIDEVQFRQDFVAGLKKQYGDEIVFDKKYRQEEGDGNRLLLTAGNTQVLRRTAVRAEEEDDTSKSSVAIVYVDGMILPGSSDPSGFPLLTGGMAYSTPIAKALDQAAEDDTVKAVVLARRLAWRIGGCQRDHPERHQTCGGQETLCRVDGQCGGQRWLLRGLRHEDDLRRQYDDHGLDRCRLRKVRHDADVGEGLVLTGAPIKRGANAGMLASAKSCLRRSSVSLLQSWMDEIYGVFKGHVVASSW